MDRARAAALPQETGRGNNDDETYRCIAIEIPWRLNTNEGDRAVSLPAETFEQL